EGVVHEPVLLEQRQPVEPGARHSDLEVVAAAGSVLDDDLRRVRKRLLEAPLQWLDRAHDAMLPTDEMPSGEHTVVINRPIGEVYAYVADKENDAEWRPAVVEISKESGD